MRVVNRNFITRNLIVLSVVSFFTDIASEMLYPIMPLYLSDIGYGVVLIGFIEAMSQLMAGLVKLLAGTYSDHTQQRKPLVATGYAVSALAKPLMGFFPTFWAIFGFRLLDKFGKGLRQAPRDALLVEASTPVNRGRVFGFHRAVDTFGATLGPLIALILLYVYSNDLRFIIFVTIVPGLLAVMASLFVYEKSGPRRNKKSARSRLDAPHKIWHYYRSSAPRYRRVLRLIILMTVLKATDIYLLLRARELGLSNALIVAAYITYNLTGMISAFGLGTLSDRHGYRKVFAAGLLALSGCYAVLSQNQLSLSFIFVAFVLYAVFSTAYEGLASAWISLHIPSKSRASGLGLMMAAQSVAGLLATVAVGMLWMQFGGRPVFAGMSLLALALAAWLFLRIRPERPGGIDKGKLAYVSKLQKIANSNSNFRTTLWTGSRLQLTVMSIAVDEDIGLEVHKHTDQFLRIEAGIAQVHMGASEDNLVIRKVAHKGDAVLVPANTFHNIINIGKSPLKVSSIYAAPEHPYGTVHKTSRHAEQAEIDELLEED